MSSPAELTGIRRLHSLDVTTIIIGTSLVNGSRSTSQLSPSLLIRSFLGLIPTLQEVRTEKLTFFVNPAHSRAHSAEHCTLCTFHRNHIRISCGGIGLHFVFHTHPRVHRCVPSVPLPPAGQVPRAIPQQALQIPDGLDRVGRKAAFISKAAARPSRRRRQGR